MICQDIWKLKYEGKLNIYCAKEVKDIVERFILDTFHGIHIEIYHESVIYHEIENEQEYDIVGYSIKILDLYAEEDIVQYGFQIKLKNGKIFTFLGDIPCDEKNYERIKNTDWVCHEVFCMEVEKEIFNPHKIHHSTIKDVAEKMQTLGVKNLVLWHTKDNCIENRKRLYTAEAKLYFAENVFVPDDLDVIEL